MCVSKNRHFSIGKCGVFILQRKPLVKQTKSATPADGSSRSIQNPLQLSARLVIALFIVVIISSKVRTVAHCNYTCATISVWKGMWVERFRKIIHVVCVCVSVHVCVCWDQNWCTASNNATEKRIKQRWCAAHFSCPYFCCTLAFSSVDASLTLSCWKASYRRAGM